MLGIPIKSHTRGRLRPPFSIRLMHDSAPSTVTVAAGKGDGRGEVGVMARRWRGFGLMVVLAAVMVLAFVVQAASAAESADESTEAGQQREADGSETGSGGSGESVDVGIAVGDIVMPAVVQIVTEVEFEQRLVAYYESRLERGELVREEGEWGRFTARVTGSGSVVFSDTTVIDGVERDVTLILTNHHVIDDALPERWGETFNQYLPEHVRVENWQQRLLAGAPEIAEVRILSARVGIVVLPEQNFWIPAEIEMYDEQLDIALVRVDGVKGAPYVKLGDSDATRVGEELYMAGAPMGLPFQITAGRLGQKSLSLDAMWRDMWRYDVAQAPGSSGSGIFNRRGELVAVARGNLGRAYFIGFDQVFVPQPGQYLGVPANAIKFLLRWRGYGFVFEYDADDILDVWSRRKVG